MMWGDGQWGSGFWVVMVVTMALFWAPLILLLVWAIRSGWRTTGGPGPRSYPSRADEVLAERFARGEIGEDEFTRGQALLRAPRAM